LDAAKEWQKVEEAVKRVKAHGFGTVLVRVQNGKVVSIDKTEHEEIKAN